MHRAFLQSHGPSDIQATDPRPKATTFAKEILSASEAALQKPLTVSEKELTEQPSDEQQRPVSYASHLSIWLSGTSFVVIWYLLFDWCEKGHFFSGYLARAVSRAGLFGFGRFTKFCA